MRHAKKAEHILNLEKETPYEFTTVQEAMPELSKIAKEKGYNLTNPSDHKKAVRSLRNPIV